jgi:DHA1 family bicyclomycin/chloramphenicol resistance-like MFS transporter
MPLGAILVLLLSMQPLATDLYLPALPQIARQFGGNAGLAQSTLTIYMLAFGLAQLGAGRLVDRYGRRRALLLGLGLYTAAAAACAMAGSLPVLLAGRALQGVATAACAVGARAVIRDRFSSTAGMGVIARSMAGMGAVACLAPVAGGLVTQAFGWQAALTLVSLAGLLAWLAVWRGFEDSWTGGGEVSVGYRFFLGDGQFLFSTLLSAFSFAGAICFLLLSPFAFIGEFGMSRAAYGFVPAACTLHFLLGTLLCRRLLRGRTVPQVVRLGVLLSMCGAFSQLALWLAEVRTVWALLLPQCVYMLGHGIHQPCGQGGSVAPFPLQAGQAAALSGFIITAAAFVAGQAVSHSAAPASLKLVAVMACLAGLIGMIGAVALPRHYRAALGES